MKDYKDLVATICDYCGLDNLYPYEDTDKILAEFKVLDELDRVYQEPNKKVKSIETQPTKVKSFQMELVETEPIQQCVIQAFKGISEE